MKPADVGNEVPHHTLVRLPKAVEGISWGLRGILVDRDARKLRRLRRFLDQHKNQTRPDGASSLVFDYSQYAPELRLSQKAFEQRNLSLTELVACGNACATRELALLELSLVSDVDGQVSHLTAWFTTSWSTMTKPELVKALDALVRVLESLCEINAYYADGNIEHCPTWFQDCIGSRFTSIDDEYI